MNGTGPLLGVQLTEAQVHAYLDVIGVRRAPPSFDSLRDLIRAQLTRVPFENVSKLFYRKHRGLRSLPGIELYLDGIRHDHFGGTCYPNNMYFHGLLVALGYDASLCGADMPSGPDVHCAIIVTIDGREYIVDVGYAAPFYEPLPRDLDQDLLIRFGRDCYALRPRDEQARSRLDLYREGELVHGYLLKPTPRGPEHFDDAVRNSYGDQAAFMNALMLVRFGESSSIVIYNLSLIRATAGSYTIDRLGSREELVEVIIRLFEIREDVVRDVVASLGPLGSVYG
ncbi:MAG: arylamine N-acetyltransferase [Acidobacteriota bacterium]